MSWGSEQEWLLSLRAIPLEAVLEVCGAHRDPQDKHKWHTVQGVLSVNGAKFMNWNRGVGGGGAIDLVIHLNNLDFRNALHWLQRRFPVPLPLQRARAAPPAPLQLPPSDHRQLGRVRHYLATQRGLAPRLLDSLIAAGRLYADARANAVFLLLGKENNPVGAELRATTARRWRGLAPGSRKDLGFFSIPLEGRAEIILCESAIDAISCFSLHPHRRCLSTAGARSNPRWLASLLEQGHRLYCGFDADVIGEDMARAMITLYPSIQRLRPSRHDWNDVLTSRD